MSEAVGSLEARIHEAPYPSRAAAWYATLLFAMLFWLSILDRFIISLLVDPIKHDLGLTDVQFGMLHGFAFMATFSLFGLAAGVLADRFNRRLIIFAGVTIWSVATAACGLAQNYWHLFLARVGVGAGEAALNPSATSMLADLFPRERLTFPMAVYAMGATVGAGTAYIAGGAIIEALSHLEVITVPLIGEIRPWQAVFLIVGLPGAFIAFLVFTTPEPVRRGVLRAVQGGLSWRETYGELLRFMSARRRFFMFHYLGFAFASAAFVGCNTWYPVHMGRTFGWGAGQIGLTLGLTLVVGAVAGKMICGRSVDAMYQRGYRDAQLRWYAYSLIAAVPFGVIGTTVADPWIFLGCVGVFFALLAPLPVCAYAAMNLVTPNELRGSGVAFFSATAGLVGAGAGPLLVPAVSDLVYGGDSTIGLGMATIIGVCCPIAAALMALALHAMREAVTEAERLTQT